MRLSNYIHSVIKTAKRIIRNSLPLCLYKSIISSRISKRPKIELSNDKFDDEETVESKFEQIISVQGFGYSGSGAVLDLLREYRGNLVQGYIDPGVSAASTLDTAYEVNFLRHSGGIFEFDNTIDVHNPFFNDALLKRFKKLYENSYMFIKSPQLMKLASTYFSQLVELEIKSEGSAAYNYYLNDSIFPSKSILYRKDLSRDYFRKISRIFVTKVLNHFFRSGYRNLILDQLFSDLEFNINRNLAFVPNLKTVVVYRDPRDVYAYAYKEDVEWIPYKKIEDFVTWYKYNISRLDLSSKDYLVIKFESLVNKYDETVDIIENYLNLSKDCHVSRFSAFNPAISVKGIGIWKTNPLLKDNIDYIERELPFYCYNE